MGRYGLVRQPAAKLPLLKVKLGGGDVERIAAVRRAALEG
jgi:hypothetical protein